MSPWPRQWQQQRQRHMCQRLPPENGSNAFSQQPELVDMGRHQSARNQTNKAAGGHQIRALPSAPKRSRSGGLPPSLGWRRCDSRETKDCSAGQIGRAHLRGSRMRQCHSLADIGLILLSLSRLNPTRRKKKDH